MSRALATLALSGCQLVFPLSEEPEEICFEDRFEGTSLGLPFAGDATEDGGQLLLSVPTVAQATGFGLTGATVEIEVVDVSQLGSNSMVFQLALQPVMATISLSAEKLTFSAADGVGGAGVASIVFDPEAMRFIRFVDGRTVLQLDTSPDGEDWTTRGTAAIDLVADMAISFSLSTGTPANTVRVDNLVVRAPSCDGVVP